MRAVPCGEHAVLLECADAAEVRAAHATALRRVPEADDVVPAARTVLVDGVGDVAALVAEAAGWELDEVAVGAGPLVEVPVRYDGPDLADVARYWGMGVDAAVAHHRTREYVAEFCGFAPGFAYCSGLAPEDAVPRLDTPRSRVPAGAVAVADTWTAVYPTASPGGWRILGHTEARLWAPDRDEPALLAPGTRVRFVDA